MQVLADRCSFSRRATGAGLVVGPAAGSVALLALVAGCSGSANTPLTAAKSTAQPGWPAPAVAARPPAAFGTLHQALSVSPVWTQFGAPEARLRSLASAVDGAGHVYVFGLAADDSIWQDVQAPDDWSGWQVFGNGTERLHTLAAQRSGDGRVEVFGTAADGSIWVNQQLAVGGSWSGWEVFGNPDDRLRSVTPVVDRAGRTQVFGLAGDDSVWSNVQQPSGSWSGWQIFGNPGDRLATIAAQLSADGRLEIFGTQGSIWVNSQTGGEGGWSGWEVLGNPEDRLRVVTPALDAAGHTQVIGLADDDSTWINSQLSKGWSGWQLLGASEGRVHTLAVGEDADGRLEVAGIALGGSLWRTAQDSPAGAWSPWVEFGSPEDCLQSLLLERSGDGTLLALGTAADDSVWLNAQQLPGQWPEVPLPLHTNLFATATLTTTYGDAPGPYEKPVLLDFTFNSTRTAFSVAPFTLEAATFSTPLGTNTTTIRYAGGGAGTFDAVTGALDMTLDLVFDQSIRLPSVDSTLRVALSSSGPGGLPRDPTSGEAAMGGSGTFRGGVLAGETGNLLLSGTFDPIP